MKYYGILFTLLMSAQFLGAQKYGNGNLAQFTRSFDGIESINIQFNADIVLDYSAEEKLSIEVDENLTELVGIEFKNGKLTLDQVEWIEPSKQPKITIGTPNLKRIFQGTHSSTEIINLDSKKLRLEGNVGQITVRGNTNILKVNVSGTDLKLNELKVKTAKIKLLGDAKVYLGDVQRIETKYMDDERIVLSEEPAEYIANNPKETFESRPRFAPNAELEFINFKIRNNSWQRKHFVVIGPKKDGNSFSYGFSMLPKTNKSEKWSVGTMIYEEKRNGSRVFLAQINEEDAGTIVELFE